MRFTLLQYKGEIGHQHIQVQENIHVPPTEGIGDFLGVGVESLLMANAKYEAKTEF